LKQAPAPAPEEKGRLEVVSKEPLADAERLLGAAHGLLVQERDDRLAERHRFDREDAVPAGIELVDDLGLADKIVATRPAAKTESRLAEPRRPGRATDNPISRTSSQAHRTPRSASRRPAPMRRRIIS